MFSFKKTISLCFLFFIFFPSLSFSDEAAKQSLLNTVAELDTFSADFKQEIYADGRVISPPESGFMQVRSPGLFCWQTDGQIIYVRNSKVIIYDKALAQVTVRPLGSSSDQIPLMLLFGQADDALKGFDISQDGENYRLVPTSDNSMIEELIIGFSDNALASLRIVGAIGQETDITFSNQNINSPLDESLFQQKILPGVDVVTVGS